MAKAKIKKKSVSKTVGAKEVSTKKRMRLGDKGDRARKKSFGIQELRPDYKSEDNVFAIVDVAYETVQDHWIEVDGKTERIVCAVMGITDATRDEKIANTYGYPDGCGFCSTKKELYENHPKDSADAVDKRARDVAGRISSKKSVYLIVVKGTLDAFRASRKSKKTITEPKFEENGLVVKKLKLTANAFEAFEDAIDEHGFDSDDLEGMPFNLVGGKKQGNSHVISRVDFFPKHKIKRLPKISISLDNVAVYDSKKAEKIFDLFQRELPDLLSGKKKLSAFGKAKKAAKKTGRRK